MEDSIKKFADPNYLIVPTKLTKASSCADDQNAVYDFWEKHWSAAFTATGAPEKGWQDHFIRQDVAVAVRSGEEIIGCHLYTLYDLRSHASLQSEYFHYISDLSVQTLKNHGLTNVMSMEYLGVSHDWRFNSEQVGVGKLVVALGTYVAEALGADGILGMPISTTKVDKMMENIGAYTVQDGIEKYGYRLQLKAARTQPRTDSVDTKVLEFAQKLWQNRVDRSGLTTQTNPSIKKQVA